MIMQETQASSLDTRLLVCKIEAAVPEAEILACEQGAYAEAQKPS